MGETNATVGTNAMTEAVTTAASSSAFWDTYGSTLLWVVVIGAVFAFLWYKGHLARLATYVQLTREELRKCSWPTWAELKGSTVVVAIAILLLGGYTVLVDFVFSLVLHGKLLN